MTQNLVMTTVSAENENSSGRQIGCVSPLGGGEVEHQALWNQHVGRALEVLLRNAGYSAAAQYRSLDFFKNHIAPNLGVFKTANANNEYTSTWQSFMTDDGDPVELSWDWGTTDQFQPTIRYSIEPIGLQAGGSLDPLNSLAGSILQEHLKRALPHMNLEWFDYFTEYFDKPEEELPQSRSASWIYAFYNSIKNLLSCQTGQQSEQGVQDHKSYIFYSFEITETEITTRVYFFPKYRAVKYGQSNLDVLIQGIHNAPGCTYENLHALSVFLDFSGDTSSRLLEYEMLAIDLVHPSKSRFKIYFRSRETSFKSLTNIMTLGGRTRSSNMEKGLAELYSLWKALFEVNDSGTLADVNHRTAGILYNVEFRLGDKSPVAKVYLPVRHYSHTDDSVIRGLDDYFKSRQRARHMPDYKQAMKDLL
ncbi:aromatic prenyltransferase [Xylaria flabelliformis]|nr:aromatic prenyltransferase [Xylaria flabelliformis]